MRTANSRFKNMTLELVTLLLTVSLLLTALASCQDAATLTAEDLPEGTVSLTLTECTEDEGTYFVLAHAVNSDGKQSAELYKLPLSSRFIGEFTSPASEGDDPVFLAGPSKFYEAGMIGGRSTLTANSFLFNDSGELILLSDALPEEE